MPQDPLIMPQCSKSGKARGEGVGPSLPRLCMSWDAARTSPTSAAANKGDSNTASASLSLASCPPPVAAQVFGECEQSAVREL
jgi:hypothetical protein